MSVHDDNLQVQSLHDPFFFFSIRNRLPCIIHNISNNATVYPAVNNFMNNPGYRESEVGIINRFSFAIIIIIIY